MSAPSARQVLVVASARSSAASSLRELAAAIEAELAALSMVHAAVLLPCADPGDAVELVFVCVFEGELDALAGALWRHASGALLTLLGVQGVADNEQAFQRWLRGAMLRPQAFVVAHPELELERIRSDARFDAWTQAALAELPQQGRGWTPLEVVSALRARWPGDSAVADVVSQKGHADFALHSFALTPAAARSRWLSRSLAALDDCCRREDSALRHGGHFALWLVYRERLWFVAASRWTLPELIALARGRERYLLQLIALQTRDFPGSGGLGLGRRAARRASAWARDSRVEQALTYSAYPALDVARVEQNRRQRALFERPLEPGLAEALCASF